MNLPLVRRQMRLNGHKLDHFEQISVIWPLLSCYTTVSTDTRAEKKKESERQFATTGPACVSHLVSLTFFTNRVYRT